MTILVRFFEKNKAKCNALSDSSCFAAVYREAVALTAYLCIWYKLDRKKAGVVICRQEGYRRGIASNHGDVLH